MSDRIAVVQHGAIKRTVDASELSHDDLVRASAEPLSNRAEEVFA
jgi:ABC-type sugar transport system ATPase subunit